MQLFINTRGSLLKKTGERFVVSSEGKHHEFSAKKIISLVIATSVCLTSDALQLANQHNVQVVFLDRCGTPTTRVWQTRMGSTARIRLAQLDSSTSNLGLEISASWILKKLQNQITFLGELSERRSGKCDSLVEKRRQLENTRESLADLNLREPETEQDRTDLKATIRGLEGTAGRAYFRAISGVLPEKYRFTARSRRPANDAYNAMLNYSYGVLYSQVENALILAGLDPFIGFFHCNRYGQPSLAFDLIEPFRIVGERTTTLLFTGRRVKEKFFRAIPKGIELGPDGRSALIEALNTRLEKTIRYPVQKPRSKSGPAKIRNIKLRDTIRHEAHSLANLLLGKTDLPSVVTTENLFAENT